MCGPCNSKVSWISCLVTFGTVHDFSDATIRALDMNLIAGAHIFGNDLLAFE